MKKVLLTVAILFTAVSLLTAQGKMGVGVQASLALPSGTFGDVYGTGFGGTGTFMYHMNKNLALTGSLGYLTWGAKDADIIDASFSSIPFMVGARYFFGEGNMKFYGTGELGFHFSSVTIKYDIPFFGSSETDASSTDLGFGFGVGMMMPIGKTLNLDVNAKYNIISTEGTSSNFIGVNAGVAFAL